VEKGTASGLAWEMSFRLLGARPWFTLWEPRVFRLAALRPGSLRYGLCTRMKDEGCTQRRRVETLFARLAMVLKPESTVKR
jgi:hypothetical protein